MTQPLSYSDDIRLRQRGGLGFPPRVEPEPGDVIIDSTGAYDWTAAGPVPREPHSVKFAIETHGEGHHETFARDEPVVFGLPVPAWCAGVLCGAAVWFPILWMLGAFS